ncbi:unnamed protein product, partial [Polarella glacialis]
ASRLARAIGATPASLDAQGCWGLAVSQRRRASSSSSAGVCTDSGVRFFTARSRPIDQSASCYAVADRLHQFAVLDGTGVGGDKFAAYCAGRLPRNVSGAFVASLSASRADASSSSTQGLRPSCGKSPRAISFGDEGEEEPADVAAAAKRWQAALSGGVALCDQQAEAETLQGGCSALFCVIARSGTYVASVGLGRAMVGTDMGPALPLQCDEASRPHLPLAGVTDGLPSRMLGGFGTAARGALPDVVRIRHENSQRLVVLGSPALFDAFESPEAPLHAAHAALRAGRSPAEELLLGVDSNADAVALVLVLPPGVEQNLPGHDQLM